MDMTVQAVLEHYWSLSLWFFLTSFNTKVSILLVICKYLIRKLMIKTTTQYNTLLDNSNYFSWCIIDPVKFLWILWHTTLSRHGDYVTFPRVHQKLLSSISMHFTEIHLWTLGAQVGYLPASRTAVTGTSWPWHSVQTSFTTKHPTSDSSLCICTMLTSMMCLGNRLWP